MNFEEALEDLKDGRPVRRKKWPEGVHIYIPFGKMDVILRVNDNTIAHWVTCDIDLLADDWELMT